VANVGLTQKQIAEKYHPQLIKRIRVDFKDHTDRGYTDGVENGFIIADVIRLTGQILHVTIVGPNCFGNDLVLYACHQPEDFTA
jgi:pyruvate/2-oxoglutarate dehydrogenase complex dihydrolipoamide dehydrogenase (E3) component